MIKTIGKFAKSVVKAGVPFAGRALEEVVENAVPGGFRLPLWRDNDQANAISKTRAASVWLW